MTSLSASGLILEGQANNVTLEAGRPGSNARSTPICPKNDEGLPISPGGSWDPVSLVRES